MRNKPRIILVDPKTNKSPARRHLDPARVTEIRELAEAVADEYFPDRRIEPEELLRRKGITFNYNHYGSTFDGMLEWKNGAFHVYCNLDRVGTFDSPRARFTLCHELGHYYIDEHRTAITAGKLPAHPSTCEYESDTIMEREADLFASNLLMPRQRFIRSVAKMPPGLGTVLTLARQFGASVTSTALQFVKTSEIECALIKWNPPTKTWSWVSPAMYDSGFGKTITSRHQIPEGSATDQALSGLYPPPSGFFSSGGTATDWFPHPRRFGHGNPIVIEQAMPIGRYGVVTMLFRDNPHY